MAAEALTRVAEIKGYLMLVEQQGSAGVKSRLTASDIAKADAVIIAADTKVELDRFAGKPVFQTSTSKAIKETESVLDAALQARPLGGAGPAPVTTPAPAGPPADAGGGRNIVAVTACPTGIAHTYMAAEALSKVARAQGHRIAVEKQGSAGAKDILTDQQVAEADLVIIAADTNVDKARFAGKPIYETSTGRALKQTDQVLAAAMQAQATGAAAGGPAGAYEDQLKAAKAAQAAERSGPYKHLLTGVSYMLPIVVAGGLLIALSFVFGIEAFKEEGTFAAALMQIGGGTAFKLMVPVLSGYIAYSVADRPGLAPGLIGGLLAADLGAGFLGGIASGFIAGYATRFMNEKIQLPVNLQGLKPVLILPLLSTFVVGVMMIYVVGGPVAYIMNALTEWLQGMGSTNAIILGAILGAMMAFDMGGPVNKAAYTFGVGLLGSETFQPMAAVMAAGMTPPLGLALAASLARSRFSATEREAAKPAAVLGLSFITEGAIPFAAEDPLRVIPSLMAGSCVAGALSMLFGCALRAPHGGVFVLAIPNAVTHVLMYGLAIIIGTVVTALVLIALKKPVPQEAAA
jgi:PTS system fructose-specific IIC component